MGMLRLIHVRGPCRGIWMQDTLILREASSHRVPESLSLSYPTLHKSIFSSAILKSFLLLEQTSFLEKSAQLRKWVRSKSQILKLGERSILPRGQSVILKRHDPRPVKPPSGSWGGKRGRDPIIAGSKIVSRNCLKRGDLKEDWSSFRSRLVSQGLIFYPAFLLSWKILIDTGIQSWKGDSSKYSFSRVSDSRSHFII